MSVLHTITSDAYVFAGPFSILRFRPRQEDSFATRLSTSPLAFLLSRRKQPFRTLIVRCRQRRKDESDPGSAHIDTRIDRILEKLRELRLPPEAIPDGDTIPAPPIEYLPDLAYRI